MTDDKPVNLREEKTRRDTESKARKPLADDEFRDMLTDLYTKHGKTGVAVVSSGAGCVFTWVGLSTVRTIELVQAAKAELVKILAAE